MLIIGVTGTIACGKSTVDALLHDLGATAVIDADRVVHALLRDDAEVRRSIFQAFGQGVFDAEGLVDRKALGAVVFQDPTQLRRLEAILYPAVRRRIRADLAALPPDAIAVIDAVKLLEGELATLVDTVWWVTARPEQQIERLTRNRGLSLAEAEARVRVQPKLADWREHVNVVIDNSGDLADTRNQVRTALNNVLAAHHHPGDGAGKKIEVADHER